MFELRKKMKQRINFITYSDTSEFSISKKDQLFKILSMLGSPNDIDMSFITDETAINYVNKIIDKPKIELNKIFPCIPAEGLDFVS